MITMFQAVYVFHVIHVIIVLLWIVPHIRGAQLNAVLTNSSHEWFKIPDSCRLLTNESNIVQSPSLFTGLGWTKMSAEYLPWVEYLGCVRFHGRGHLNATQTRVRKGEQLKECILYCKQYNFFGLQNLVCVCLQDSKFNGELSEARCNKTVVESCSGDSFAFCGREDKGFLSVYQQVIIDEKYGSSGNCLSVNPKFPNNFIAENCSRKLHRICINPYNNSLTDGGNSVSNWKDAFSDCHPNNLLSHISFKNNTDIGGDSSLWLSNTRRWTQIRDAKGYPRFCVAARIKPNGDVKRRVLQCTKHLPGICIKNANVSSGDPAKPIPTLQSYATSTSRLVQFSAPLRSTTLKGQRISTYSVLLESTFVSQPVSSSPAPVDTLGTSSFERETTSLGFQKITSPDILELPTAHVPDTDTTDGISGNVIIAIIAAAGIIVIVIIVTVVLCRRKRNTQVQISNESLGMVGKEVVYAQVNKPTIKHEESTSSQKSQQAASDDTYDHMDHRRLSQTHNPTESNYDTMRSIANAGEEENNYDHVTGTKNEPKRFVVDGSSNYSHVEVDCHEVKDILLE